MHSLAMHIEVNVIAIQC